jgi:signal transduction histidine kinase
MRAGSLLVRMWVTWAVIVLGFAAALLDTTLAHRALIARLQQRQGAMVSTGRTLEEARQMLRLELMALEGAGGALPGPAALALLRLRPADNPVQQHFDRARTLVRTLAAGTDDTTDGRWANLDPALQALQDEHRQLLAALHDARGQDATAPAADPSQARALTAAAHAVDKRLGELLELVVERTSHETAAIEGLQSDVLRRGLGTLAAALALSLLMLLWTHRALRPLQQLTRSAERMRDGDYAPPPVVARGDEVGRLAEAFAGMAASIAERDAQLRARSAALQQALADLMEAQRARVDAERLAAVGELTSRITHELRNPLSSIGLNVEMLQDELGDLLSQDHEGRQMLQSIDLEVRRLMELTDGFLSMARGVARWQVVDLGTLVDDVLRRMQAELDHDGVAVRTDGSPMEVFGDPGPLRQVLINLLRNAQEALRGLPRREVTLRFGQQDHDACLWISDSGPGVAPEVADRLFEAFVTGRTDGTGLGLRICRDIALAHRGTLTLEAPDAMGGARFLLRLPLAQLEGLSTTGESPGGSAAVFEPPEASAAGWSVGGSP